MTATKLCLAVLTAWLTMSGCASNVPKSNGESQDLYSKHGMEVSKAASEMADTLVKTLKQDLKKDKRGGNSPAAGIGQQPQHGAQHKQRSPEGIQHFL